MSDVKLSNDYILYSLSKYDNPEINLAQLDSYSFFTPVIEISS